MVKNEILNRHFLRKILGRGMLLLCFQVFLGLFFTYPVHAAEYEWNGFQYTMEYGKITITGYTGEAAKLTIPSTINGYPVDRIKDRAFQSNDDIESVYIADSVTTVEACAFEWCHNLTTVRWGNGADTIPWRCFNEDSSLTTITNAPKYIDSEAFLNCISITSVDFPKTKELRSNGWRGAGPFAGCVNISRVNLPAVQIIGESTFNGCMSLKTINLPEIRDIGGSAFSNTGLTKVTLGNKVKSIYWSFRNCKYLTSINLPNGLETIEGAFEGCTSLTQITLPSTLNNINGAFVNSGLTSVTVPVSNSLDTGGAFRECDNLTSVVIHCNEIGDGMFEGCKNLASVTIGDEVNSIRNNAFLNCVMLKSITIPERVTWIGRGAFSGCDRLVSIQGAYNSEAERFAKDIGVSFSGTKPSVANTSIALSQDSYTYNGKARKPEVTVVHNGQLLTKGIDYNVTYKNNVSVGTATVQITGTGKYTGSTTLNFTIRLDTTKTYKSGNLKYKVVSAGKKTVKVVSMVSKKKISVTIPATVKIAGDTYKVTSVDAKVFQKNKYVKTVVLGKYMTTVPAKAFYGCSKLSKISVKSTQLKSVGSNALKGVKKNIRIEVPKKQYSTYKKLWSKKGATVKIVKK